jgi:hypothetical protein
MLLWLGPCKLSSMILQNKALKVAINQILCPFYMERTLSSEKVFCGWSLGSEDGSFRKIWLKTKNRVKRTRLKKIKKSQPNYP